MTTTTKRKPFTLPPLDAQAFALALDAYRDATAHRIQIDMKWEPRLDAVKRADKFSSLYCRWENETYGAQMLLEFARGVFLAASLRGRPFPEQVYALEKLFDKLRAKKLVEKVRAAYAAVDRTKTEPCR